MLWYSEVSEFCICAASRNAFSKKNSFLRRPFAPWPLCSSSKYAVKYFLFLIIGRGDGSLGEWIKRGRESEREREREGEKLLPVKMV